MDIDKVRELTDAELTDELSTAKRHLYDLRFQLATRQLTDYSQIPQTRRSIARILTVMTERKLADGVQPTPARTATKTRARTRTRTASGAAR